MTTANKKPRTFRVRDGSRDSCVARYLLLYRSCRAYSLPLFGLPHTSLSSRATAPLPAACPRV